MYLRTNYKGPGVYAIMNTTKPVLYIGSSQGVQHRIESHYALLKSNKHYNKELQNDYNMGCNFKVIVFKKFDQVDNELLHIVEYSYMFNCLFNGFDLYNVVGVKTKDLSEEKEIRNILSYNCMLYFTKDFDIKAYLQKYHNDKPGYYIRRQKAWYEYEKKRLKPRNTKQAAADQE